MLHLLLNVVKRQLTTCFNHRSPSKLTCVAYMLMSLSIHFHGLHLDAQYGQRIVTLDYCALYEYSYLVYFLTYMTSVDTITQWREDWSSASVVNHTIVTDPTIRQPGFDLPRHTWSLLNRFPGRSHVVLTCTNGVSPNHLLVIVASDRPRTTLSTRAH